LIGERPVSVVIPCLDAAETLPEQLDALASQECTRTWEVVLVDNGSSDSTVEIAESYRGRIPTLRIVHEGNRGRHYACNAGARAANGENLIFVDGDDRVAEGFLQAMSDALEALPMVAARLDHAYFRTDFGTEMGQVQTDGLIDSLGFLPWASGAALGIRKSLFREIGGFGNQPFCEDVDLSWRAQILGTSILFEPAAVLFYRQRASLRAMFRQHRNYGAAAALLYREYRRYGMPRRPGLTVAKDWFAVVRGLFGHRSRSEQARATRRRARCLDRLIGSLRYGTFYL